MSSVRSECRRLLSEAGIHSAIKEVDGCEALVFEGATVLGFAIFYPDTMMLLENWSKNVQELVIQYQFGLRRAQGKAWNTYAVLLANATPNYRERVALSAIEEDLIGTRKIARGGVADVEELRTALLPLLPIQSAVRLEAVDMKAEIQLRTTELTPRAVEAFLSTASEVVVAQMLEEMP